MRMAECHSDRKHYATGLCLRCYKSRPKAREDNKRHKSSERSKATTAKRKAKPETKLRELEYGARYRAAHKTELSERNKAYRSNPENKKTIQEAHKEYRIDSWESILLYSARHSSRTRGMPEPEITEADILGLFEAQQGLCYWFGIPMTPSTVSQDVFKPSLDRLDNSKGYTKDNVVLSTRAANIGRGPATAERFAEFCAMIKRKWTP